MVILFVVVLVVEVFIGDGVDNGELRFNHNFNVTRGMIGSLQSFQWDIP